MTVPDALVAFNTIVPVLLRLTLPPVPTVNADTAGSVASAPVAVIRRLPLVTATGFGLTTLPTVTLLPAKESVLPAPPS